MTHRPIVPLSVACAIALIGCTPPEEGGFAGEQDVLTYEEFAELSEFDRQALLIGAIVTGAFDDEIEGMASGTGPG
ncbi:MAG: hypothetical protein GY898_05550 [Proteobacteria bacterium]|nr:hypothetical protein [Pseudomonadota bacterium]